MSEWDFLYDLEGDELMEAMMNGGTKEDFEFIEEQERKRKKREWEALKKLRDTNQISKEEFKKRKAEIFE